MRIAHFRAWNILRNTVKTWKMRNAQYRTWNMASNTEKRGK